MSFEVALLQSGAGVSPDDFCSLAPTGGNFETGFRGWQFAKRSLCRMPAAATFAVPPRRITFRQTRETQE
ncbi:hypothetical protein RISK_002785 [Rhodopirellula islandica]|uniref:Uncharacterized protein n=1 Tax=Rhodopirellula islandica TaxID=595434 RepID=A0A0J1BEK7_RHOIS|nr:hypothetical protein RISK_002785 [Rhodopirellula islandica]